MISLYSIKRIVRLISIVIFSVFLVLSAVFLFARYILPFHLPEAPYSLVIADKDGEEIGEILTTDGKRHRSLLKDEIPEFYKKALTDLEDKRFFSHPGFDAIGFGRAMLENIKAGKITQGGSTLSMGLVRNSLWLNDDRTIGKKFLEILYAIRLEGKISKEDILSEYANHVSYGRLSLGLASAAKSYFNKEVRNLTDAESLALITMGKNPSTYDAITEEQNFRKRFTLLADTLEKDGVISSTKKTEILTEKFSFPKPKNPLPYTIDAYKKLVGNENEEENSGRAVRTTIDKALTQKIEDVANGALSDIAWKNVGDYSVLLIDRDSLEIRVLIGWANYDSVNGGQVNAVFAPRQVGSTLKPFIYLMAFEKFGLTPKDQIIDLPVAYETEDWTSYEPKNYSLDYRGALSMGEALAGSVNIPAIRLTEKIGVDPILQCLRKLGVSSLSENAEHYGLSLGLGTGEISLFELVRAYSLFAKGGKYCSLVYLLGEKTSCETISDKKYTDMIEEVLSKREYKVRNFPIGSALDFSDRFAFVKTGTSRNFRDNYAIGYTDHYLIGIWTGNKNGDNMKGVSWATGAGEIFGKIVRLLEVEKPTSGISSENFSENTALFTEITSPLQFAKYRIDPSIPENAQKIQLTFRTNQNYSKKEWTLDGKSLSSDFIGISSLPQGKHTLILRLFQNGTSTPIEEKTRTFEIVPQE